MLTAPTVADFRARYPAFGNASDDLIDTLLGEALGAVDESWIPADQKPALLAYAAHLLTLELYGTPLIDGAGGQKMLATGPLSSVKIGEVSASFSDASSAAVADLNISSNGVASTVYGRRYLELLRRNKPPVWVV